MAVKARVFNIMQYEKHPETGEVLLTEDQIKIALDHRTIKRYAYICHDKDVYSALDEENNELHKQGMVKPRHWHICLEMGTNQVEIGVIARWFKISDNYVNVAKGHGAFLDIVQYLTHEGEKQQEQGKRLYDDAEVKANFDFRTELTRREENKLKYGRDLDVGKQMLYDVLYNGMTLNQCIAKDKLAYLENMDKLKKYRLDYISRLDPPSLRINFYVSGRGGVGKGLMCRAIARSLFPNFTEDAEIFFEVGAKGAAFEGYDGQPVIIWNDRRHGDLLKELHGRGNVFNVFDTHPTKQKQNIKYGSVNLCNVVNIVNSVEPYEEFLDGFVAKTKNDQGEWEQEEDKGQSYRRFPFIIPLYEEDFTLMLNRGFMEGTDRFTEYIAYEHIRGNMQRLAERCKGQDKLLRELNDKTVLPITQQYHKAVELHTVSEDIDEDAVRKEFEDYGTFSFFDDV